MERDSEASGAIGQPLRWRLSQKEQPSTKEVMPTSQATVRWPTIGASQCTTDAHARPSRPPLTVGEPCRRTEDTGTLETPMFCAEMDLSGDAFERV